MKITITDINTIMDKFPDEESDFVKNLRNTRCKGCFGICKTSELVLMCYAKTLLPEGEYEHAVKYDIMKKVTDDIYNQINKNILNNLKNV